MKSMVAIAEYFKSAKFHNLMYETIVPPLKVPTENLKDTKKGKSLSDPTSVMQHVMAIGNYVLNTADTLPIIDTLEWSSSFEVLYAAYSRKYKELTGFDPYPNSQAKIHQVIVLRSIYDSLYAAHDK